MMAVTIAEMTYPTTICGDTLRILVHGASSPWRAMFGDPASSNPSKTATKVVQFRRKRLNHKDSVRMFAVGSRRSGLWTRYAQADYGCRHGQDILVSLAVLPRTHSSARIQPRSSSFVITKTWRSGVPHWRNGLPCCSRRSRGIFSSLIAGIEDRLES